MKQKAVTFDDDNIEPIDVDSTAGAATGEFDRSPPQPGFVFYSVSAENEPLYVEAADRAAEAISVEDVLALMQRHRCAPPVFKERILCRGPLRHSSL